jgi:hypothetical protein
MKRLAVPVLCLFLCVMAACGPSSYERVAQGVQGVALAVQGLQAVVVEGNLRGTISTDDARAIMRACVKISEANSQASGLVRQLSRLKTEDRINLYTVLHPVLATVDQTMELELLGVTDPALKLKIKIAIGTMQLTLRAIEAALVQGGENAAAQI